jgi:hypothetical protein
VGLRRPGGLARLVAPAELPADQLAHRAHQAADLGCKEGVKPPAIQPSGLAAHARSADRGGESRWLRASEGRADEISHVADHPDGPGPVSAATIAGDALGVASGVVAADGTRAYVQGWLHRGAMPNRISWTWWTLVSAAVAGALLLHHAPWPLLVMPAESTAGCAVILALSLIRGSGEWDATARALTVGVVAAIPAWLVWPHATPAVALSAAVELAGDVPTIGGAWRHPQAEPADSWARVAVSGALALAAAAFTHSGPAGYLLAAAWVLGGTAIFLAAHLGSWARQAAGRRERVVAACFLALAPAALAVIGVAGFEIVTGTHVPGIPVFTSAQLTTRADRPLGVLSPQSARSRRERGHRRTRDPALIALPPLAPSQPASPSPSPSRARKPSPAPSRTPSPRRPSPTRTPRPTPSRTSPYPSPTTATPSPAPTASPSTSPGTTGTPSPTPSPAPTYPSPSPTASPSPTYTQDAR